jgi:hypothetical protein
LQISELEGDGNAKTQMSEMREDFLDGNIADCFKVLSESPSNFTES